MSEVFSDLLPDSAISWDIPAFDNFIRSQGVPFIHWRAMRCPVGMIDQDDGRRPHDDHSGCSNGFIYTRAGTVTCLFSGNGKQSNPTEIGILDGSSVQLTLPRFYDGTSLPVLIAPFDRLYLSDDKIAVVHWQLVTASPTGIDRLHFPAVDVQDIIDNQARRYTPGDYELANGQLKWLTQSRPAGLTPETGKGAIYAIRYTYRPYFYVKSLTHEVRVAQAEDGVGGQRTTQRLPQAIVIQREFLFEKEDRDSMTSDPASPRQVAEPMRGSFGPR